VAFAILGSASIGEHYPVTETLCLNAAENLVARAPEGQSDKAVRVRALERC
jgi:hypothetical protein